MPLSKKRDKARKKLERAVQPSTSMSNLVQPNNRLEIARQALADAVQPRTDAPQSKSSPLETKSSSSVPLYNKRIHRTGDKVRMRSASGRLIEVVVPELDGDGNPVLEI